MTWGKKTGRMKPCTRCGTEFYCPPSKEAGSPHGESLYCSNDCYKTGRRNGKDADTLLWERIDKNHPSGCWVYSGATDRRGYGRPATKTIRYYAHRRSYEIHKGPIPPGMLVLHRCDNPPCCNPEHLFLGTDHDNVQDKLRKGRHPSKLNDDQVREIKRLLTTDTQQQVIAKQFGVGNSVISSIKRGKQWKHVN